MKRAIAALLASIVLQASPAAAQTVSAEAAQTVGQTSDGVAAAATQVRLFGDALLGTRFTLEAAWAERFGAAETDAFSGAYPYRNRVQVIEAYGERTFRPHAALLAVHGGRFRTPGSRSMGHARRAATSTFSFIVQGSARSPRCSGPSGSRYSTAPPRAIYATRYTTGARVRIVNTLAAQVNLMRQHGMPRFRPTSLDVALTYVFRFDARRSKE